MQLIRLLPFVLLITFAFGAIRPQSYLDALTFSSRVRLPANTGQGTVQQISVSDSTITMGGNRDIGYVVTSNPNGSSSPQDFKCELQDCTGALTSNIEATFFYQLDGAGDQVIGSLASPSLGAGTSFDFSQNGELGFYVNLTRDHTITVTFNVYSGANPTDANKFSYVLSIAHGTNDATINSDYYIPYSTWTQTGSANWRSVSAFTYVVQGDLALDWVLKFFTPYANIISGRVYKNCLNDCTFDAANGDVGISSVVVRATLQSTTTFFEGTTLADGTYSIGVFVQTTAPLSSTYSVCVRDPISGGTFISTSDVSTCFTGSPRSGACDTLVVNLAEEKTGIDFAVYKLPTIQAPSAATIDCTTSSFVPGTPASPTTVITNSFVTCTGTITYSDATASPCGANSGSRQITRTWSITDSRGNVASSVQSISIRDNFPPSIVAPSPSGVSCTAFGDVAATSTANTGTPTASDTCSGTVTILGPFDSSPSGSTPCARTVTRSWTAQDACGNQATTSQQINFTDTVGPTWIFPVDQNFECSSPSPTFVNSALFNNPTSLSDNCAASLTFSVSTATVGTVCTTLTLQRTFTMNDGCSNSISSVQNINIQDRQGPVFSSVPIPATFTDCTNISFGTPAASDACFGTVSVFADTPDTPQTPINTCNQSFQRRWTATDACGNTAATTSIFTVEDNTPPRSNSPVSLTADCTIGDAIANSAPVAFDFPNCHTPLAPVFQGTGSRVGDSCAYTFQRTWLLNDGCASTSFVQTYSVRDSSPPTLAFNPPTQVAESIDCTTYLATGGINQNPDNIPTATFANTDNCQAPNSIVTLSVFATTLATGATPSTCRNPVQRTYTFTDGCSNQASITQTFTIVDSNPPVVTPPGSFTAECDFNAANSNTSGGTSGATATDACDGWIAPTSAFLPSPSSPTGNLCSGGLVYTRRWFAQDICGNQGTADQQITVTDTALPTVNPPSTQTQQCSFDSSTLTAATATDACDSSVTPSISSTSTSVTCTVAIGRTTAVTVTWSASDDCSNSATSTSLVNVVDQTAPTITGLTAVTFTCAAVSSPTAANTPTVTDNCASPSLNPHTDGAIIATGVCTQNYSFTRTWTATDGCLVSTFSQTVNIVDNTPPVFGAFTSSFNVDCGMQTGAFFTSLITSWAPAPGGSFTGLSATDPTCSNSATTTYLDSSPIIGAGVCSSTILRSWTAYDACGNSATAAQTFILRDITSPTITLVGLSTTTITCGASTSTLSIAGVTASDICSTPTITNLDTMNTDNICSYTITRVWTATDSCSNTSTLTQTILWDDQDNPVITAPSATAYDCTVGILDNGFTVSDPCSRITNAALRASVTSSVVTFTSCTVNLAGAFDSYARRYTVTDACGFTATSTQFFSVIDVTGPNFSAPTPYTSSNCQSSSALFPSSSVSGFPQGAVDACTAHNVSPFVFTFTDGSAINVNNCRVTGVRTWFTNDLCGNQSSRTQLMNVVDSTPPTFSSFPPTTSVACTVTQTAPNTSDSVFFFPGVTDDCQSNIIPTWSDDVDGGCSPVITRTWSIYDGCNPTVSRTQRVTLLDDAPPVVQDLPDLTLNCSQITSLSTVPPLPYGTAGGQAAVPTVVDACDTTPTLTYSDQVLGDLCPDSQVIVRSWVATDDCRQSSTEVVNIRIVLDQQPRLTVPGPTSIDCSDGTLPSSAIGSKVGTATATQACGVAITLTYQDTLSFNECPETITRVWFASDACGNRVNGVQDIRVTDGENPQFLTIPPSITINCEDDTHPGNTGFPLVSDNCDIPVCSITWFDVISEIGVQIGTCKRDQRILRTFVARDSCLNESTATQEIFIEYVEVSIPCDGLPCAQDACRLCECDISRLNCECCERGGAASCLPVNCNAVACSPKANCNPVPCIACPIDLNDSTSPLPFCDNSTVPCIPNIVPIFVDDADESTAVPDNEGGDFDSDYWQERAAYWRERFQGEEIQAASTSQLAPLVALLVLLLSLPFTFYTFLLN